MLPLIQISFNISGDKALFQVRVQKTTLKVKLKCLIYINITVIGRILFERICFHPFPNICT